MKFAERKKSSIINMRTFHNWTKRVLLSQTCDMLRNECGINDIKLLDLAVGKGNDMQKWHDNGIMYVVGFDIDESSINEANIRYNQLIKRLKFEKKMIPKYKFYVMDLSLSKNIGIINDIIGDVKFNVVSCQFAIHYFFRDVDSLNTLITVVKNHIHNQGFFIGTTMDGVKIAKKLESAHNFGNDIFMIEKEYDVLNKYGSTYLVSLGKDSDSDHYFVNKKSKEYIVDIEVLKKVCEKFGLVYVGTIDFESWYSKYKGKPISDDEKGFSFLNFSFVFKHLI